MSDTILPVDVFELAKRVVAANRDAGRTSALAESCTGGLVAAALTEVAGSSAVLDRGYVTYSNEAKQQELGVPLDILEAFGAVSVATAFAMAKGALERSGADVAVAVSGIAGPGGGNEMKPVGTVVFALAVKGEEEPRADERLFEGENRAGVRRQATLCALELLLP